MPIPWLEGGRTDATTYGRLPPLSIKEDANREADRQPATTIFIERQIRAIEQE
jgi:hypothetical protein